MIGNLILVACAVATWRLFSGDHFGLGVLSGINLFVNYWTSISLAKALYGTTPVGVPRDPLTEFDARVSAPLIAHTNPGLVMTINIGTALLGLAALLATFVM